MKERIRTEVLESVSDDMSGGAPKRSTALRTAIIAVASTSLFALALVTLNHVVFAHAADGSNDVLELVQGDVEGVYPGGEGSVAITSDELGDIDGATFTINSETDIQTSIDVVIPSLDNAAVTVSLHPYIVSGGEGEFCSESDDYYGYVAKPGTPAAHHLSATDAIIAVAEHIYAEYGVKVDGMTTDLTFFIWRDGPYSATWEGVFEGNERFLFVLNATTGEIIHCVKFEDDPYADFDI